VRLLGDEATMLGAGWDMVMASPLGREGNRAS
jgi:hypothetical protein